MAENMRTDDGYNISENQTDRPTPASAEEPLAFLLTFFHPTFPVFFCGGSAHVNLFEQKECPLSFINIAVHLALFS